MPLEIATYLNALDPANPTGLDPKSQGDDHIRLIKTALKATFPSLNAPVTATPAQINKAAMTNWVRQGGGVGQMDNELRIGWTGAALNLQVDAANFGSTWPISVTGAAANARNATTGYFSAVSASGPILELHKPGHIAGGWYISTSNRLTFGPTQGDGQPTAELLTLDIGNGNQWIAGTLTQASDEKLKTNWRPVAPDFVAQLAGVKAGVYNRLDTGATQVGVSAQSLRHVLPEAVLVNDFGGELSVAYANAALVACVELAKAVTSLRAEMDALKARA